MHIPSRETISVARGVGSAGARALYVPSCDVKVDLRKRVEVKPEADRGDRLGDDPERQVHCADERHCN